MSTANDSKPSKRLVFSREFFDDYFISLSALIRVDNDADNILEGDLKNPLTAYQQNHRIDLRLLRVPFISDEELRLDPVGTYKAFVTTTTRALNSAVGRVPDLPDLDVLDDDFQRFRAAERFIYNQIVKTLQVGISLHYARQVRFGAGQQLLAVIEEDNRRVTTRALMALFAALFGIRMKADETFEQYSRRLNLLVQRLINWRPPIRLPEELLLF